MARVFMAIGLTGGIASGKSTVLKMFDQRAATSSPGEKLNVEIIDADVVGHEAYAAGTSCYHSLVDHFGEKIREEDGTINRKALASIVFGDPDEMKNLQRIVWPEICTAISDRLEQSKARAVSSAVKTIVIVEAAIMLEAKWHERLPFDLLVALVVDPNTAKERLMARNQLSAVDAEKRIGSQISNAERAAQVHAVIDNSGTQSDLELSVDNLFASRITPLLG